MDKPDTSKWDRYSGDRWSSLRAKAQETQQEYESGENSETVKHQLADRLREILGGVTVAGELIPRIMAEHKKAVEWGLERLLVSAKHLKNLPYVETQERKALEQRITNVITLVDAGEYDQAESEVREIQTQVERLHMASLDTEIRALLAGIGEVYEETVH